MAKLQARIEISEEIKQARQQESQQQRERETKRREHQAKFAEIETSKAKGSLTQTQKMDMIILQNELIIELLQALQPST